MAEPDEKPQVQLDPPDYIEPVKEKGDSKTKEPERRLWKQDQVRWFYNTTHVQISVAVLISSNFFINMVEKQVDPSGTKHEKIFGLFGFLYNVAFTIELALNMYAHWFHEFWMGPTAAWNYFDSVVVAIGLINIVEMILPLNTPPSLNLLRLMRAFRVFRLFKRIKALNKIITSIIRAIPGVMNAFLILTIVMCIYAILAVEFFQNVGEGCKLPSYDREGFQSIRKFCVGNEYFGSFSRSFYSFFQVLTGESWSEMVARPMVWFWEDDPFLAVSAALFFVSFVLVTGFVLINVVVAVLLDKMTSSNDEDEDDTGSPASEAPAGPPPPIPCKTPPLSKQEKAAYKQYQALQGSLTKVASRQAEMQGEFERTRAEMAQLREQLGTLAKAVERRHVYS